MAGPNPRKRHDSNVHIDPQPLFGDIQEGSRTKVFREIAMKVPCCERSLWKMAKGENTHREILVRRVCAVRRVDAKKVILSQPRYARRQKHSGKTFSVKVQANLSIYDLLTGAGRITLPPQTVARFHHASGHWTHDCFDQEEQKLLAQSTPLRFPVGRAWDGRLASSASIETAQKELDGKLRFVVDHILLSYGLPQVDALRAQDLPIDVLLKHGSKKIKEAGIAVTPVLAQLQPYVRKLQHELAQGRPLFVQISSGSDLESRVVRAFWRRFHGEKLIDHVKKHPEAWASVGPWITCEGHGNPTCRSSYPLPSAPAGSMIAVVGSETPQKGFTQNQIQPFFSPMHEIVNNSRSEIIVFLRCNDERSGDNLGDITIHYSVSPV